MSDRELLTTVAIGIEAENFITSSLGQALIARAEAQREDAIEELSVANAENPAGIRDLQNKIWQAESFQRWLADIITEGHNATTQIAAGEITD